ncbi:hypothetical protein A2U01_0063245, partial [Trifolium medium]|nr:hypothetical protein [Trifolium medium]
TITLEEVQATLRTKKLTKFKDLKVDDSGEGLNVSKGRSENGGNGKGKKFRSKSRSNWVVTKQSTSVSFVTPQFTSRRTVLRDGAVVVNPFRLW